MMSRENVLEKIRACLALGDKAHNPNPHEAENALRLAQKLMADYNLSMADVAFSEANVGKIREEQLQPRSGVPKWETQVAFICDHLFNTRHYLKDVSAPKKFDRGGWNDHVYKRSVVFYGYDVDVALSVEVYKLLKLEILGMARRWEIADAADKPHLTPGEIRSRRFSYCEGVVWNLLHRAKQQAESLSAADAAKVRDLVIKKDSHLYDWAAKMHPDLHPVRARSSSAHEDAVFDGTKDGKNVSLNFKSSVKGSSTSPAALPYKGGNK